MQKKYIIQLFWDVNMKIKKGKGKTKYGSGINIKLSGSEIATAIDAYLVARNVHIRGPRTIRINDELCKRGNIYVDPIGFIIKKGKKIEGNL